MEALMEALTGMLAISLTSPTFAAFLETLL
jgi:hypothetical protein